MAYIKRKNNVAYQTTKYIIRKILDFIAISKTKQL